MRSTQSLRSFPSVASETVPTFDWRRPSLVLSRQIVERLCLNVLDSPWHDSRGQTYTSNQSSLQETGAELSRWGHEAVDPPSLSSHAQLTACCRFSLDPTAWPLHWPNCWHSGTPLLDPLTRQLTTCCWYSSDPTTGPLHSPATCTVHGLLQALTEPTHLTPSLKCHTHSTQHAAGTHRTPPPDPFTQKPHAQYTACYWHSPDPTTGPLHSKTTRTVHGMLLALTRPHHRTPSLKNHTHSTRHATGTHQTPPPDPFTQKPHAQYTACYWHSPDPTTGPLHSPCCWHSPDPTTWPLHWPYCWHSGTPLLDPFTRQLLALTGPHHLTPSLTLLLALTGPHHLTPSLTLLLALTGPHHLHSPCC